MQGFFLEILTTVQGVFLMNSLEIQKYKAIIVTCKI